MVSRASRRLRSGRGRGAEDDPPGASGGGRNRPPERPRSALGGASSGAGAGEAVIGAAVHQKRLLPYRALAASQLGYPSKRSDYAAVGSARVRSGARQAQAATVAPLAAMALPVPPPRIPHAVARLLVLTLQGGGTCPRGAAPAGVAIPSRGSCSYRPRATSSVPSGPIPICAAGVNATRERERTTRRSVPLTTPLVLSSARPRGQAGTGLERVGSDVGVSRRRRDADRRPHRQRGERGVADRPCRQIHDDRGRLGGDEFLAPVPLDHEVMRPFSQERGVGRNLHQPRPRFTLDRAHVKRVRVPDRDFHAQGRLRTLARSAGRALAQLTACRHRRRRLAGWRLGESRAPRR